MEKNRTPEVMEAAREYSLGGWKKNGEVVPSIAGLALHLGRGRPTLYRWAAEDADFAEIMERVKTQQEAALLNGGLSGELNATITKLMLANHGYTDKQSIDYGVNPLLPTRIELVAPDFDNGGLSC